MIVAATIASLVVVWLGVKSKTGSPEDGWLDWADILLCAVFLVDFVLRGRKASDWRTFVRRNWIDLLAAVPMVDALRAGRMIRVLRLMRLMRVGFVRGLLRDRYGLHISTEFASGVGFVAVVVWVATALSFYAFERHGNPGVRDIGDALWWSMTTLSTVGYGDLYPYSLGGRVVAVFTMLIGVGVIGTLAATVATAFMDMRDRGKKGLRSFQMKGHLLVLGWNEKSAAALKEFRVDPRYEHTPVVLVADEVVDVSELSAVSFVRGAPTQSAALRRASADQAGSAIIFAANPSDPRSDHETALSALSLRRINPEIHISAELVSADNHEHLSVAGCSAVVEGNAVTSALLVASVQDSGISDLVSYLLSSTRGSELHRAPVPASYIGGPYRDFAVAMAAQSKPVLGIAKGGQVAVNPAPDTILEQDDDAFIAARPDCQHS